MRFEGLADTVQFFLSQEHRVTVEVYRVTHRPAPAILILHGADGLGSRKSSYLRLANGMAERGYVVFLLHYFDRTRTVRANKETTRNCFLAWRGTVIDALDFIAAQPDVSAQRVGLLGFSLGATIGLSVAGRHTRIRAIAEFSGVMPDPHAFMARMPPTLILHGAADEVVAVEEAYKLEGLLKERAVPYEIRIYPNEGHIFGATAVLDGLRRAVAFFDRHLDATGRSGDELPP